MNKKLPLSRPYKGLPLNMESAPEVINLTRSLEFVKEIEGRIEEGLYGLLWGTNDSTVPSDIRSDLAQKACDAILSYLMGTSTASELLPALLDVTPQFRALVLQEAIKQVVEE